MSAAAQVTCVCLRVLRSLTVLSSQDENHRQKAAPRHSMSEQGVTTQMEDQRDPTTRYFREHQPRTRIDPNRASVVNPDGSNIVAGVSIKRSRRGWPVLLRVIYANAGGRQILA